MLFNYSIKSFTLKILINGMSWNVKLKIFEIIQIISYVKFI
jgi:hypothetical protein